MQPRAPSLASALVALLASALVGCLQNPTASQGAPVAPQADVNGTAIAKDAVTSVSIPDAKISDTAAGTDDAGDTAADAEPDVDSAAGPADAYSGPACTTTAACKNMPGLPYCAVYLKQCVECLFDAQCADTGHCAQNKCTVFSCTPGTAVCDGPFLATCNQDGKSTTSKECPAAAPVCNDGKCKACEPNATFCAPPAGGGPSLAVRKCDATGDASTLVKTCEGEATCQAKQCLVCVPGTKVCVGGVGKSCAADGGGFEAGLDCGAKGLTCVGGQCVEACGADLKNNSNVGCDYWAVDLDNAFEASGGKVYDAQNAQFAVIVSNTSQTQALVTVSLGAVAAAATSTTWTVPPKGLQVINLPDPAWGVPNQSQEGSDINSRVFHIQATQPIVAYQFNPLQNVGVFSNDASLLLPTGALGEEYWVASHAQLGNHRSYFTVVAATPGTTTVQVVVAAPTLAGPGVPAMTVGAKQTFSLQQGQVLNIESNKDKADLTGSWVKANKPVAVFGGSEASISPDIGNCINNPLGTPPKVCAVTNGMIPCTKDSDCPASCCADHLEEQLFPVKAWGKTYVGARLSPRGKEQDTWRIVAAENGTQVKLIPDIGITLPTLNQGAFFQFQTTKDFLLEADKPVMLAQYMASSFSTMTSANSTCTTNAMCMSQYGFLATCEGTGGSKSCGPIGDPSLILDVATSQYLDEYLFLVPDKYALNYITVIAPQATVVKLDGSSLGAAAFVPVPDTTWQVARLPIGAGTHTLVGSKKVALFVYGYDDDVSYGYPGGAGL